LFIYTASTCFHFLKASKQTKQAKQATHAKQAKQATRNKSIAEQMNKQTNSTKQN